MIAEILTKYPQILATSKNKHLVMKEIVSNEGEYYQGQLDHLNRPYGYGFFILKEGEVLQGFFIHGKNYFTKQCFCIQSDLQYYFIPKTINSKPTGFYATKDKEGNLIEGYTKNGFLVGECIKSQGDKNQFYKCSDRFNITY